MKERAGTKADAASRQPLRFLRWLWSCALPAVLVTGCAETREQSARGSALPAPTIAAPAASGAPTADAGVATDAAIGAAAPAQSNAIVERTAATDAAARVLEVLDRVQRGLRETKYEHVTRIDERRGIFRWDCSSMAEWVLRNAAPKARSAVAGQRPLARDFFKAIRNSPTEQPRRGWLRLDGPERISPGDVFAWVKPPMFRNRNNTGHVGFVVTTPRPSPCFEGVWLMGVADATRMIHGDDSRTEGGDGGYGTGVIAFLFDAAGVPIAYGWYGKAQDPNTFVPTTIVFGRVAE